MENSKLIEINLKNLETSGSTTITFIDGISINHVRYIENHWKPILANQESQARLRYNLLPSEKQSIEKYHRLLAKKDAQDFHWDWEKKYQTSIFKGSKFITGLDGVSVEGVINTSLKQSLIKKEQIIYVDFLAVAPWNRKTSELRRYKNIGTILIALIVENSFSEGFNGRCGLESLPQSEGFYERIGMTKFPKSDTEGLTYYEFTEDNARKFIKGEI